jgi:hypothetical protein
MTADQTVKTQRKEGNYQGQRCSERDESHGITATVVWMVSERGDAAFEE